MSKRPQCSLHAATHVERATIENFIDWLRQRGIVLCVHEPTHFASNGGTYYQTTEKPEDLASDFVGIDRDALEKERSALIESIDQTTERK